MRRLPPLRRPAYSPGMTHVVIRLDLSGRGRIGPGKVALLEQIGATGSISAAGRALGMSYRRAWLLVEELNRLFKEPVVSAHPGGAGGGGTALTAFGRRLVADYRAIEAAAQAQARARLAALEAALAAEDDLPEAERSSWQPLGG
jgi:molybdate transport system regulatory protein